MTDLCPDRTQYDMDQICEAGARINTVSIENASKEDPFFGLIGDGPVVFTLGAHHQLRNGMSKAKTCKITDVNRVEGAVAELAGALKEVEYDLTL